MSRAVCTAAAAAVLLLMVLASSRNSGVAPSTSLQSPPPSAVAAPSCPSSSNFSLFLKPMDIKHRSSRSHPLAYALPPIVDDNFSKGLTPAQLENETVFAFIHINKAGGTLFKYKVLHEAAKRYKWSGAGFGSVFGWQRLVQGCDEGAYAEQQQQQQHAELDAFACGVKADLTGCGPRNGDRCPMRVVWGSQSLPLCSLFTSSCVMSVVLRHPVERLISQYNYVCIEGSEGRKKWALAWKQKNRCPLTLLEFLARTEDLTSETFLIDHLALSAGGGGCGKELALQNLFHPCMRYLLLDRLQDGLGRLAKVWGPAMQPLLDNLAKSNAVLNSAAYSPRIQSQIANPDIMQQVTEKLKLDIALYDRAVLGYEEQWKRPLVSCI
ncbi:hypothetical protein BASA81_007970 [Batrachochytrium salamandrivorans]|nr:hypothetical protein BASA81_007970 [Batrachochytrium salamandrivorans]